jgi:hypothetical protein
MYDAVVDIPLVAAGCLAIAAAAVHGAAGEVLVMRKLSVERLPPTRFGGPRMTRAMIHVAWHITTIAFFTAGAALLLSGSVLHGDAARGLSLVGAAATTGYAAVVLGLGVGPQGPRALLQHGAPVALTATAALAWWGAL